MPLHSRLSNLAINTPQIANSEKSVLPSNLSTSAGLPCYRRADLVIWVGRGLLVWTLFLQSTLIARAEPDSNLPTNLALFTELWQAWEALVADGHCQQASSLSPKIEAAALATWGAAGWQTRTVRAQLEFIRQAMTWPRLEQRELGRRWHHLNEPTISERPRTVGTPVHGPEDWQRSIARLSQALGQEHLAVAIAESRSARQLFLAGKTAPASEACRRAKASLRHDTDHPALARALEVSGLISLQRGDVQAATQQLGEAYEQFERALGTNHRLTRSCRGHLAHGLTQAGALEEAAQHLEELVALNLNLYGRNHVESIKALLFLASNRRLQGRLIESEQQLRGAVVLAANATGNRSLLTASCLSHLGISLRQQGRYHEAEQAYLAAWSAFQTQRGELHPQTATCVWNLALVLRLQERFAEAESHLERLLEVQRKLDPYGRQPLTLSALELWLTCRRKQGKSVASESFERLLRQRLRLSQRRFGDVAPQTAAAWGRLGQFLFEAGRFEEAQFALASGLSATTEALGDQHADSISFRQKLGEIAFLNGETDRTVALLTTAADDFEALRRQRGLVGLREITELHANRHLPLLAIALASTGRVREAWDRLEQGNARGLLDELARREGPPSPSQPSPAPATLEQIQSHLSADTALVSWVAVRWNQTNRRIVWACIIRQLGAPNWIRLVDSAGGGDDPLESDREQPIAKQFERAPTTPFDPTQLREIRESRMDPLRPALRATADLPPVAHLVVIFPGPSVAPVEMLTDDYTISYAASGTIYAQLRARPNARQQEATFAPRRILALGDPAYLPPHTSVDTNRDQTETLRVSKSYPLLPGTATEIEAIGNLFGDHAVTLVGPSASEARLGRLARDDALSEFRYLHFAAHGEFSATVPFQSALVLADHGRPVDLMSAINSSEGDVPSDGRLTARQIMEGWRLNADLVTLSACQTGLGPRVQGEHFLGFPQAMLIAGSRSVVVSLWAVRDDATSLLMKRFYENLLGKREDLAVPMPKAVALSEAKRWLRQLTVAEVDKIAVRSSPALRSTIRRRSRANLRSAKPFEHPYFWAPFILIGDPG